MLHQIPFLVMEKEPDENSRASQFDDEPKKTNKEPKTKVYRCSLCPFFSFDFAIVSLHISEHNEKLEKEKLLENTKLDCNRCDFIAQDKNELLAHKTFHKESKDPFRCSFCQYSSTNKSHVDEHENAIHVSSKIFKCRFCPFETRYQKSLMVHMRRHTGEKPFKCRHCEWKGYEAGERTVHERTHTGVKPYRCKQCDYASTSASGLNAHNRKHTQIKSFQCPYCDFKTATSIRLRKHILNQHSLKYCNECSFSTLSNKEFREHSKVHTLRCLQCQKTFGDRQKLREHQSVHTGKRKYNCEYCEYNSNKKSLLANHINKKHPSQCG